MHFLSPYLYLPATRIIIECQPVPAVSDCYIAAVLIVWSRFLCWFDLLNWNRICCHFCEPLYEFSEWKTLYRCLHCESQQQHQQNDKPFLIFGSFFFLKIHKLKKVVIVTAVTGCYFQFPDDVIAASGVSFRVQIWQWALSVLPFTFTISWQYFCSKFGRSREEFNNISLSCFIVK